MKEQKHMTGDPAVVKATGRSLAEWTDIIIHNGFKDKPHRDIAEYLNTNEGVSAWWSQQITVLFEQKTGRRIPGETADGKFQTAVTRTINASTGQLWSLLTSPEGLKRIICDDIKGIESGKEGLCEDGLKYKITHIKHGSHFRLQWQKTGWTAYSILQVRITPKYSDKAVLSFEHEKLPDSAERENMKAHWTKVAQEVESLLAPDRF